MKYLILITICAFSFASAQEARTYPIFNRTCAERSAFIRPQVKTSFNVAAVSSSMLLPNKLSYIEINSSTLEPGLKSNVTNSAMSLKPTACQAPTAGDSLADRSPSADQDRTLSPTRLSLVKLQLFSLFPTWTQHWDCWTSLTMLTEVLDRYEKCWLNLKIIIL